MGDTIQYCGGTTVLSEDTINTFEGVVFRTVGNVINTAEDIISSVEDIQ